MGEMVVTGLSLDGEKQLRHAWQLAPGQIFDNSYFEKLLKVLARPRPEIFGDMPIHYTQCGHWLRPNTDGHTVDVLLDLSRCTRRGRTVPLLMSKSARSGIHFQEWNYI